MPSFFLDKTEWLSVLNTNVPFAVCVCIIFYTETKRIPFATLRIYLFLLNVIANARIINASRTGKMQLPAQRWFCVHGTEEVFLHIGSHAR